MPAGLVSRVTLTVAESGLDDGSLDAGLAAAPGELGKMMAAALRAARRARIRTDAREAADAAAGGCAHHMATPAYRPPPALRDYVTARDQTCRYPSCRRPAWRSDLDHTVPYDQGGRTCGCNLGGGCRGHHIVKHLEGWTLRQPRPGFFEWITPAGRVYQAAPGTYPV